MGINDEMMHNRRAERAARDRDEIDRLTETIAKLEADVEDGDESLAAECKRHRLTELARDKAIRERDEFRTENARLREALDGYTSLTIDGHDYGVLARQALATPGTGTPDAWGLYHDSVHEEVGKSRPAKATRVKGTGTEDGNG